MPYVGSVHTATSGAKADGRFECAACGLKKLARAHEVGVASAHSPLFIGASSGGDRATTGADADAADVASTYMAIVPCPACGVSNPEAVRAFVRCRS